MLDPILKEAVIEYTEMYDKENIDKVEDLIYSIENSDEVGNEFQVDMYGFIGGIIIGVLHKRYITDIANYLPPLNSIINYFRDKYWKKKLFLAVMLQYNDEKEAKRITNSFFKIIHSKKNNKSNKFSLFNPFYFFYNSLKIAFFLLCFQMFYLISISIKYYNPNVIHIEDDPVFKYMYSNSENINLIYLHNTFGSNKIFIVSLLLTIFIFYTIKLIFKNIRNNHLKRKKRIGIKEKKKLIRIFPQLKPISIFTYSGINPYVYRTKNNNPSLIIPEKILEDINSDKSKFIIFHEIYHIINKDYLVNRSVLKVLFIILVIVFFVSLLLFTLIKSIGIEDINILFYVTLYALIIWGFIASNKLIEFRADYYAYLRTNINYQSYSIRNLSFFENLRYPNSKEKQFYIEKFPKKELSLITIFLLIIISETSVFLTFGFIPFINMLNSLLLISVIIIFNHISKINLIKKLSYKKVILGYFYWFISIILLLSIFMIATFIEGVEYDINYVINDIYLYFIPFLVSIPFLVLSAKMKRINYSIFYLIMAIFIILSEFLFKDSLFFINEGIENYPNWLHIIFIFGSSYFVFLLYSIKNKKPMGNKKYT